MNQPVDVTVNEMMREIVRCSEGKGVAVFTGYVSSIDDDMVRLHEDLDPDSYMDIPREGILYSTMTDCGQNKLVVNREAELSIVRREKIGAGSLIDGGGSDGGRSDGVSEFIDLSSLGIKVIDGLKFIAHVGNCLALRQRFDEFEAILAETDPAISDAQRAEVEQTLLRLDVDMQSCPMWIRPD